MIITESINFDEQEKAKSVISTKENSINDHKLDEYPLNFTTERRNLDTYAYYYDNPKRDIELKDYRVTDGDHCRNLINDLQNEIAYKSESVLDGKPIDYAQELNYILKGKEGANKKIDTNPTEAKLEYKNLLRIISKIEREISEANRNKTIEEILHQKKLIYSNLSMANVKLHLFKESAECDKKIIEEMDEKFDKSYARLINSYIEMDNLNLAERYASMLKTNFKPETVKRYDNILKRLEDAQLRNEQVK